MKKYVKSTLTFFSIVLLILLVFSIRLLSAEINIVKENSDYNGVTIQIKTDIKLYKIKLYKKASNGKFVLFYKSNLHGANNLKIKVSRNLLSTTDKTEIKVVAYDEDGNSLTCGGTIDPVPSAVPMNPSETAKPTSTSSPIPTKPTPTTTATSTSTSTASTSPSSSATATSSTSPSSSATTSETPSSSPSSSSTATPTADTPSSLQDIIKSDQPLTAEQVGQILAYNARVMYEHKKSFGYNVNYGSAVTKKKWDYSVNSSHKQVTSKKAYKYAKHFNCPICLVDKRRNGNDDNATATSVIGEIKGKNALIFDDEVDTAGSIMETVDVIKKYGAKDIYVGCTHGVLSNPAIERIRNSEIKELVMTNTIPLNKEKQIDKIVVVSITELFAEAIKRINEATSIGELFETN